MIPSSGGGSCIDGVGVTVLGLCLLLSDNSALRLLAPLCAKLDWLAPLKRAALFDPLDLLAPLLHLALLEWLADGVDGASSILYVGVIPQIQAISQSRK